MTPVACNIGAKYAKLGTVDPRIKQLVGDVTEEQLRHVEVFLASRLGLFVPVLGQ